MYFIRVWYGIYIIRNYLWTKWIWITIRVDLERVRRVDLVAVGFNDNVNIRIYFGRDLSVNFSFSLTYHRTCDEWAAVNVRTHIVSAREYCSRPASAVIYNKYNVYTNAVVETWEPTARWTTKRVHGKCIYGQGSVVSVCT